MYGFVLEAVAQSVKKKFGDEIWEKICKKASVKHTFFVQKKVYSETIIPRVLKAAADILGQDEETLLEVTGKYFITYISQYGYDRILRVLGRHLRDFINGLDNLHDYLRFTYPKMKPPSFFCEDETRGGLTLHYRSKRRGYLYYMVGQITTVAEMIYDTPISIDIISEEETLSLTHITLKLHFNNTAYVEAEDKVQSHKALGMPLDSDVLYDVFPFHIVFTKQMLIKSIGSGLQNVMPDCINQALDEMFTMTKPLVEFSIENIMLYSNNVFELISADPIYRDIDEDGKTISKTQATYDTGDTGDASHRLRLKGQMEYMQEWDAIIFLGTPIMDNLEKLYYTGMFINDLSMHDWSRDLVLVGTQQQTELKQALAEEKKKSEKLEESMKKVDEELKRTDALLYQMIPKIVADRLKNGESAVKTCQTFDDVTILFTDVVGFTSICSPLSPMEVVGMLNCMYTKFDQLSEEHRVFKVETIGDAYMVVSGAPTVTTFHAMYVTEMGFDLIKVIQTIPDPSKKDGSTLRIRVGIHSGPVVAGCVGVKMPRYCLVGETVNIANKMESSGAGRDPIATYWCNGKDDNTGSKKGPNRKMVQLE